MRSLFRKRCSAYFCLDVSLFLIAAWYVWLCPFTKVEESFNVQAAYDLKFNGVSKVDAFDHLRFPGVVPRTFVAPLFLWAIDAFLSNHIMNALLYPLSFAHLPQTYFYHNETAFNELLCVALNDSDYQQYLNSSLYPENLHCSSITGATLGTAHSMSHLLKKREDANDTLKTSSFVALESLAAFSHSARRSVDKMLHLYLTRLVLMCISICALLLLRNELIHAFICVQLERYRSTAISQKRNNSLVTAQRMCAMASKTSSKQRDSADSCHNLKLGQCMFALSNEQLSAALDSFLTITSVFRALFSDCKMALANKTPSIDLRNRECQLKNATDATTLIGPKLLPVSRLSTDSVSLLSSPISPRTPKTSPGSESSALSKSKKRKAQRSKQKGSKRSPRTPRTPKTPKTPRSGGTPKSMRGSKSTRTPKTSWKSASSSLSEFGGFQLDTLMEGANGSGAQKTAADVSEKWAAVHFDYAIIFNVCVAAQFHFLYNCSRLFANVFAMIVCCFAFKYYVRHFVDCRQPVATAPTTALAKESEKNGIFDSNESLVSLLFGFENMVAVFSDSSVRCVSFLAVSTILFRCDTMVLALPMILSIVIRAAVFFSNTSELIDTASHCVFTNGTFSAMTTTPSPYYSSASLSSSSLATSGRRTKGKRSSSSLTSPKSSESSFVPKGITSKTVRCLWRMVPRILVYCAAAIALTTAVDYFFWDLFSAVDEEYCGLFDHVLWPELTRGRVLWPELQVFYYNAILNESHSWGVSPFHDYFTKLLPKMLAVCYPLTLASLFYDHSFLVDWLLPAQTQSGKSCRRCRDGDNEDNLTLLTYLKKQLHSIFYYIGKNNCADENTAKSGGSKSSSKKRSSAVAVSSASKKRGTGGDSMWNSLAVNLNPLSADLFAVSYAMVAMYSFLPHKEVRFLYLVQPLLTALAFMATVQLLQNTIPSLAKSLSNLASFCFCCKNCCTKSVALTKKRPAVAVSWRPPTRSPPRWSRCFLTTVLVLLLTYSIVYAAVYVATVNAYNYPGGVAMKRLADLIKPPNAALVSRSRMQRFKQLATDALETNDACELLAEMHEGYFCDNGVDDGSDNGGGNDDGSMESKSNGENADENGDNIVKNKYKAKNESEDSMGKWQKRRQMIGASAVWSELYCVHICNLAAMTGAVRHSYFLGAEHSEGYLYFDKTEQIGESQLAEFRSPCGESTFQRDLAVSCSSQNGSCWHWSPLVIVTKSADAKAMYKPNGEKGSLNVIRFKKPEPLSESFAMYRFEEGGETDEECVDRGIDSRARLKQRRGFDYLISEQSEVESFRPVPGGVIYAVESVRLLGGRFFVFPKVTLKPALYILQRVT